MSRRRKLIHIRAHLGKHAPSRHSVKPGNAGQSVYCLLKRNILSLYFRFQGRNLRFDKFELLQVLVETKTMSGSLPSSQCLD